MTGPALVDIHATQLLANRSRGITRYVHDLALHLDRVGADLIDSFLLDPELALPGDLVRLAATGKLRPSDTVTWGPGTLLHLTSPYELGIPLRRLLPDAAVRERVALVVTLYDLIPEVMPDHYFAEPGMRLRYRSRHQLVRSADAVLTLSEASRCDAVERLGLDPDRARVVGAGVDEQFVVPPSRAGAARAAAAAVPGLRPPFVLYTGGTDPRKNVDGLLAAWSRLPDGLATRYQLVLVGAGEDRARLGAEAERLGVGDSLLVPGRLSDAALLLLYQGTHLFVYPSLYEGYGLPVAEALACGAPVVAAGTSSLPEIVDKDALFDPTDPDAISGAVARALTDERYRASLLARAGQAPHDWAGVARRTVEAYDAVLGAHRGQARGAAAPLAPPTPASGPVSPRPAGRPRLALVTPVPPQPGPVAAYSQRLTAALAPHADIEIVGEGPLADCGLPDLGLTGRPFDAVVYVVANSARSAGTLAALARRPGIVLAHDVRFIDAYAAAGALPAALAAIYPNRLPPDLGASGAVSQEEADWWGLLMAREVISSSLRFLAISPLAAALARLDAGPADREKVGCLPLALEAPGPARPSPDGGPPRVVVLAPADTTGDARAVAKALAALRPDAHIAMAGHDDDGAAALAAATVAVVVGRPADGSTAHAVARCLALGLPPVVPGTGAVLGLADGVTVPAPVGARAVDLAALAAGLLDDGPHRQALAAGALALAAERTFARTAEDLLDLVLGPAPA